MGAEEKKPEGEKIAGLPKLWWIIIAVVIIAIVIGVVVYYATRPPVEEKVPLGKERYIITPVTRTKTTTITGFTGAAEVTHRTVRIPKYVDKVKISLIPGEDESGTMWPGAPGDDLFSIKVTTSTGEEWSDYGARTLSKTFKINKPPKGEALGPVDAFAREIATVVGNLYPSESWDVEVGVSVPVMDPEDPGNSWTIEVEYTYWEPQWIKA